MTDLATFLVMGPLMVWPATIGVAVLGLTAAVTHGDHSRRFGRVALLTWLLVPVVGLVSIMSSLLAVPSLAIYDVIAWVAVSTLVIGVSAAAGIWAYARRWTTRGRVLMVLAVGGASLLPAPIMLLVLHCMSGDCL